MARCGRRVIVLEKGVQREACASYIASQRHEGWQMVKTDYDDGGFSGGNVNRPALKQLMEDVEAGKIDVIVVYTSRQYEFPRSYPYTDIP